MTATACTRMILRLPAGLAAAIVACFSLGCGGPQTMLSSPEARVERLTRLLSFETRREQSAIARRSIVFREPQLKQHLEEILVRLMPGEAPQGVVPQVVLISDFDRNAYSLPDGAIYISTGLLSHLENEAELALLLAHELAHVTRRHALRALAASPAATDETVFVGRFADSLAWFHDVTAQKDIRPESEEQMRRRRDLEQEADRVGLDMVIKANYDPYEAIEIFEHLRDADGRRSGENRAAALRQSLNPNDSAAGPSTDRAVFREHLQQLLFEQARLELRHGRWDEALRCTRRLLLAVPTDARGHFLLGEILRQRDAAEDVPLALAHYLRAIAADPSLSEAYKAAGLIHLKQGQARRARGFFESALALAPLSLDNEYIRSYLYQCIISIEGGSL